MIDGIGIAGYRSFGNEKQLLEDFGKINIIIGKNNSGKSNILRFIWRLKEIFSNVSVFTEQLDVNKDANVGSISHIIQFRKDQYLDHYFNDIVEVLPKFNLTAHKNDSIFLKWIHTDLINGVLELDLFKKYTSYNDQDIEEIAMKQNGKSTNSRDENIKAISKTLSKNIESKFKSHLITYLIPDRRWITNETPDREKNILTGKGFLHILKDIQRPSFMQIQEMEKFKKMKSIFQNIIHDNNADILMNSDNTELIIQLNGQMLPLENYGTGIHQLILFCYADVIINNTIICVEEPEIFLHPELLKTYINFLSENSSNQYFISTHSNALLDCENVNIYSCKLENGFTKCTKAISIGEKYSILDDLGCKASDILQSNCIIWVEGPSDRIYLNHWIKQKDPKLKEGLHYSIMFYGGKLLSHLSTEFDDSEEMTDFIKLRNLNRNTGIVIDSDKPNESNELNQTKKRIIDAYKDEGFYWVTNCREIENYIEETVISNAIREVHGEEIFLEDYGQFSKIITFKKNEDSNPIPINKVKVARKIIKNSLSLDVWDLSDRIDELVMYINKCNSRIPLPS